MTSTPGSRPGPGPRLAKSGSAEDEDPGEPFERVPTGRRKKRPTRTRERAVTRTRPVRGPATADRVAQGPDADPEAVARKILLDALTGQARSRKELADKLAKKDVPTSWPSGCSTGSARSA